MQFTSLSYKCWKHWHLFEDIIECDVAYPCAPDNSTCEDNPGSYTCECKDGYEGDPYVQCQGRFTLF